MSNLGSNLGMVGNINELVQDYFTDKDLTYTPTTWDGYPDKYSYIYADLIKTKGPDLIKLANLQNYLSEWTRPYSYGGWLRSISIGPVIPMDPPGFANGSTPDNGIIAKADVRATHHPFKIRTEFMLTQFVDQLKEAMSSPAIGELGFFLERILMALTDGANDTMYRFYKEIIWKFYSELTTDKKAMLTNASIPATIQSKADAILAVNTIRNISTQYMFGKEVYNAMDFKHTVTPDRQRLYLVDSLANAIVDNLKLDHFMGDVDYSNIAGSLSQFLGIPVRLLDDLGGLIPYGAPTDPQDPSTAPQLYPIFNADGSVSGTYAATPGGTTSVPVDHWGPRAGYAPRALLTEDDWGNVFPLTDKVSTAGFIRGGGYVNTSRYIETLAVAKPQSNTVYFT